MSSTQSKAKTPKNISVLSHWRLVLLQTTGSSKPGIPGCTMKPIDVQLDNALGD